MLFRAKKSPHSKTPPAKSQTALAQGHACECRALVLIDVSDQKHRLVEQIREMQQRVQLNQARVERFHQIMVPAFGSWMDREFHEEQERARELEQKRRDLRKRLGIAQYLHGVAPHLTAKQLAEVVDIAITKETDPLEALHAWEKLTLLKQMKGKQETPAMREKRLMDSIASCSDLLCSVIVASFQQSFEQQGNLHVETVPSAWINQIMNSFVEHYREDDGNPVTSLALFLRQERIENLQEQLVADFIDKHFPKKRGGGGSQEERMNSFFEDLEQMFESLGKDFFDTGRREKKSGFVELPSGPCDGCKTVFRRLARQLHPDTGACSASTAVWMEVQRLYRRGDLQGLLAMEMDLTVKSGDLPVDHLGLCHLMETCNALERTLRGQKSEWARLSRRPEAKLDRDAKSPSKLKTLITKLRNEMMSEITLMEEDLCNLQVQWIRLEKGRSSARR